jgi:hypothetical protein
LTTIELAARDNENVIFFHHGTQTGTPTPITNGLTQNSTSITVSNASGIHVGSILSITELNDTNFVSTNTYTAGAPCTYCGESGQRCLQQFALVTNVSGNVLGITPPLLWAYTPSLLPQAQTWVLITNCGVESMTVKRLYPSTNSYGSAHCISFDEAAWCWVTNVETCWPQGAHVKFSGCFQCQIESCYFHDGWTQNSGQDYGVWIFDHNSHHLIENSIFHNMRHAMVFEAGGAACVFAYNFATNVIAGEDTTSFLSGAELTHGAHPWFNLYEGNVSPCIRGDYTHGSASHNTYFREHITLSSYAESNSLAVERAAWVPSEGAQQTTNGFPGGWIAGPSSQVSGEFGVDFEPFNYSNSVVGCVFNTNSPGTFIAAITNMTASMNGSMGVIQRLGYESPGATGTASDAVTQASTYWHGNWNPITRQVEWNPSNGDMSIPSSLYLSALPTWWPSGLAWPSFGPDLSPMVGAIPAQLRWEKMVAPLLPPANLHIIGP